MLQVLCWKIIKTKKLLLHHMSVDTLDLRLKNTISFCMRLILIEDLYSYVNVVYSGLHTMNFIVKKIFNSYAWNYARQDCR